MVLTECQVVNLSLGGPKSGALNKAVAEAVKVGLTVFVAAGDERMDAGKFSPSSEPLAFTVGSAQITDSISTSSSFGKGLLAA
jgi:serine protease